MDINSEAYRELYWAYREAMDAAIETVRIEIGSGSSLNAQEIEVVFNNAVADFTKRNI